MGDLLGILILAFSLAFVIKGCEPEGVRWTYNDQCYKFKIKELNEHVDIKLTKGEDVCLRKRNQKTTE